MGIEKFQYGSNDGKWSTKKVEAIMKYIDDTGIVPKDNPFHERDVNWRKANINFQLTKEEITQDIIHFAETYARVRTDYGQKIVKLRPYQKRVLLQFKKFRFNVYLASRQVGKCITSETLIHLDIPGKGRLTMPIFEAYYLIKKKMGRLDKLLLWLYRQNYKLFLIKEHLSSSQ
jgi:hypothetical protein